MSNKFVTTYNGGFTILPNTFILNPNVSCEAKCLMLLLMQYAWNNNKEVYPSVETITYHLNWSNDRFQKYKKELIAKGFMTVTQAKSNTNQFSYNVYTLSPEINYTPDMEFTVPAKATTNKTNINNINNINFKTINNDEANKEIQEIYEYWNSRKHTITHRKLTDAMKKAAKKALKEYHIDDILDAIDNYDEVLAADYYFNTVWGLDTFLKQPNTLPDFINDGAKWLSYLASKKTNKAPYKTDAELKMSHDTTSRRRK